MEFNSYFSEIFYVDWLKKNFTALEFVEMLKRSFNFHLKTAEKIDQT